jgi:hypothetical protein
MNQFQEHAANLAEYEQSLQGDGTTGAVLTVNGAPVPCTHSEIIADFKLMGGQSSTTFIQHVTFLASALPANYVPAKGKNFSLKVNPQAQALLLKFWHGGLQQGGLIFRFMAVDAAYKG